MPQTDKFVCICQIYCLRRSDTGCWMLDDCCSEAEIPSSAGIKTLPFTLPRNIINLLYGLFRQSKKIKEFLISSSIQQPASCDNLQQSLPILKTRLKISDLDHYRRLVFQRPLKFSIILFCINVHVVVKKIRFNQTCPVSVFLKKGPGTHVTP